MLRSLKNFFKSTVEIIAFEKPSLTTTLLKFSLKSENV